MCGLVGVAGNLSAKNRDIFTELLLVDVVRGSHSTGVAGIHRFKDKVQIEKGPSPSPFFVRSKQYNDLIKEPDFSCLIGHNRYATIGQVNKANAHPFSFPNIVGAHNGTLDSWTLRLLENYKDYETDSEALFATINNKGIKETINSVSGAWALSYYNSKNNTLNLLRNDRRPLHYAYNEKRDTLYWASEANMLEWVVKRNSIKMFDSTVYVCEPDSHYSWKLPKFMSDSFEKPTVSIIEGKKLFMPTVYKGYYEDLGIYHNRPTYHHSRNDSLPFIPTNTSLPTKNHDHKITRINTKKFRPPYKDYAGKVINKPQFIDLVKTGCVFCDESDIKWGNFILSIKPDMDGRKLFLCDDCYNDDEILELVQTAI